MKKITLLFLFLTGSVSLGYSQFSENFDAATTLPSGWSIINNGDTNEWYVGTPASGNANSGSNVARIDYSATSHDDYLITPQFTVTVGSSDLLTLWAKNRSDFYIETFDILLSTTGTATSDFTNVIASTVTPTTSWAKYTYDLTAYAGQTVYIAFYSSTTDEFSLYLDDISALAAPTCFEPNTLASIDITATDATITWNASNSNPANGYDYYYSTSNTAPDATTVPSGTISGGATLADLTGLTPTTVYYYWVRSNCSLTDKSIWIGGTFTTPATPPANDACADAIDVTCGSSTTGTTTAATNENAAVCGISGVTTQNTPGVWYRFVGDGSEVTVTTCSPNVTTGDSRIAVFSGACGALTCVGGNDDASLAGCSTNALSSTVTFNTVSGTDYYILVYAYLSTTLSFELNVECTSACAPATTNDDCDTALALTVGTTTPITTDNSCATPTLGLAYPSCSGLFNTYYDTWYYFDTDNSTAFDVTLSNPTGTTGFVVYSGTCGALTQVTGSCYTGAGTASLTGLNTASRYYIRAYSTTISTRGSFDLAVTSTLATNSFDNGSFSYYPNPVKNILNLSYNQEISNVEILNLLGQRINNFKVSSNQTQVDMSNLAVGTYIVKVTSNGLVKSIKVTKE
jgi:hypothetical protein